MTGAGLRALQAAVIAMGVLIIAGVAVLAVLLAQRAGSSSGRGADLLLDEPQGSRIAAAQLGGDRLVIQLQGGGPDRVVVLDLRSGRVIVRAALPR